MKRCLTVFITVFLIITLCLSTLAAVTLSGQLPVSDSGGNAATPGSATPSEPIAPSEPVTPSEPVAPSDDTENKRPALVVTQEPVYPNWRLFVALPEFVSDRMYITPYFSFDGETFTAGERLCYTYFSGLSIEPDVEPMNSFTEGREDEFFIYLQIEGTDYNGPSQICKVLRSAEKPELPTPEPEKITVQMNHAPTGWRLSVTLPYSVRVGTKLISPEYSLDGTEFSPVANSRGEAFIWEDIAQEAGENLDRLSLGAQLQPMKDFVEKKYDKFYFRMNIEGDNYNGYSSVYLIERTLEPEPIPDSAEILASLPPSSEVKTSRPPSQRGLFHVTVREGASHDTLLSYLPTMLPVTMNLQSLSGTPQAYLEKEATMYDVNWTLPQDLPKDGIFKDCIELVPPADGEIFHGVLANYEIFELPRVQIAVPADLNDPGGEWIYKDEPFDLAIHVIPADEKIAPQLGMTSWNGFDEDLLAFSLPSKPSGATSIVAEYSLDGGKSWQTVPRADGNNLIELGYKPDRVPKQENYAAPLFFDNDKTPMKEYLADNTNTFLVRLNICGGVYDGISEAFSWPGNYNFDPPLYIDTDSDGGEGNRGDVGSGDDGNGGVRPELPNPTPDPTPNPTPEPTPDTVPEPAPDPTPESTPDTAPEPTPDTASEHTSSSKPKSTHPPVPDTKQEAALPPIQTSLDVSASPTSGAEIESEEAQPPSSEEPSAPPESSASVKSTEPTEQTMKPVRKPDAERAVSPLAVTVIAAAAIAVAGGMIAVVGGAGIFSAISAKAAGLIRKLISFFTHP